MVGSVARGQCPRQSELAPSGSRIGKGQTQASQNRAIGSLAESNRSFW